MNFPIGKIEAVLLTHFHSDHISDLGELMMQRWTSGSNTTPLDIIGPPGVETVVDGFNLAYKLDTGYRIAHHGEKTAPPSGAGGIARPFNLSSEEDASVVVIDKGALKVTAFKVNHAPVSPAVGYRFDYKGRTLVISGDTAPCDSVRKQSQGVDVLIHEALQKSMIKLIHDQAGLSPSPSAAKMTDDIPDYHCSPEDAAKIAGEAGVRQLVFYHVIPPIAHPVLAMMFLGDTAKYFQGQVTIGEDGMLISLPAGSRDISIRKIIQ
jgi:ribonuclease Z